MGNEFADLVEIAKEVAAQPVRARLEDVAQRSAQSRELCARRDRLGRSPDREGDLARREAVGAQVQGDDQLGVARSEGLDLRARYEADPVPPSASSRVAAVARGMGRESKKASGLICASRRASRCRRSSLTSDSIVRAALAPAPGCADARWRGRPRGRLPRGTRPCRDREQEQRRKSIRARARRSARREDLDRMVDGERGAHRVGPYRVL